VCVCVWWCVRVCVVCVCVCVCVVCVVCVCVCVCLVAVDAFAVSFNGISNASGVCLCVLYIQDDLLLLDYGRFLPAILDGVGCSDVLTWQEVPKASVTPTTFIRLASNLIAEGVGESTMKKFRGCVGAFVLRV